MIALREPVESVSGLSLLRVPSVACREMGREGRGFPAESTAETEICHGPPGEPSYTGDAIMTSEAAEDC